MIWNYVTKRKALHMKRKEAANIENRSA